MILLSKPALEWVGGDLPWRVVRQGVYLSGVIDDTIIVPVGFRTDLASVPRIPLVYSKVGGKGNTAAVFHDFLYRYGVYTRKECDKIFLEIMNECGDPESAIQRKAMYYGVRVFGKSSYKKEK